MLHRGGLTGICPKAMDAQSMLDIQNMRQRIQRLEDTIQKLHSFIQSIFNTSLLGDTSEQCEEVVAGPSACNLNSVEREPAQATVNTVETPRRDAIHMCSSIKRPIYNGKCDQFTAAEFLERFEAYIHMKSESPSNACLLGSVFDCLSGEPKVWYRAFSYKFTDWGTFKILFLKRFWGNTAQRAFMEHLQRGSYEKKGGSSKMSSYFARIVNKSRYLAVPPTEEKLLFLVKFHFPRKLQNVLSTLTELEQVYNYLAEEDLVQNSSSNVNQPELMYQ